MMVIGNLKSGWPAGGGPFHETVVMPCPKLQTNPMKGGPLEWIVGLKKL